MSFLIRPFRDLFQEHLSDDDLTLLINSELPPLNRLNASQHLAGCQKCGARLDMLEYAASQVIRYRDDCVARGAPRRKQRRDLLAAQLERLSSEVSNAKEAQRKRVLLGWAVPEMNPILATGMVFALASVLCTFMWLHQARPSITSNALLVHAEVWDPATANGVPEGVIRQTVRIRASKQTLERAIYRDAQGRRRPKQQVLASYEEELKNKLVAANVAWDAPLSAATYQDWHDRQRVRQDQITRSGRHLLVLTTTTPNGDVAAQSLTVRDTDFHPVERTVAFRDSETVEIAELDYQVLPWAAMNGNEFEPMGALRSDSFDGLRPPLMFRLPMAPSAEQLDETELGAKLVLNRLHADTGEQIQISRNGSGIEVKGLVETDQRKRELLDQLRVVPHLKASILSLEELENTPIGESPATSLKVVSESAQPSPLEMYFVAHGRDANALRSLSQQLLSSALAATQESRAVSDLLRRFTSEGAMTPLAKATLATLVFSHKEKLLHAVEEEQELLTALSGKANGNWILESQQAQTISLVDAAERNLTLCEELSLGGNSQPRSAEAIFLELTATMTELSAATKQAQLHSEYTDATASGKE